MSERAQHALRVAVSLLLLSLVVFAKFHEPPRFFHTLQKLAHPITFGALALLILTLLKRKTPRHFRTYIVAFILTVLCGAGTELAQAFVDRDPSVLDVLRDALGASTALVGFATLVPGSDARGGGRWRVMGALFALLGLAIIVTPISISLAAYARRDLLFPTLFEACSTLDRYFVTGRGANLNLVPSTGPASSPCGTALRVTLSTTPYPGIVFEEPYPDWRTASTLVLYLNNPGEIDLPLAIRVNDLAHNFQFDDRFNRGFTLPAHERLEITIPISEIEHAPAGRRMDLSRIADLAIFRARGATAGSFDVERMLLRR
jgi:VanZ family protein